MKPTGCTNVLCDNTCAQDASITLKVMIAWPCICSWQWVKCSSFCLSAVNPLAFVWSLWKLYGDEPLTDSCASQSDEHPFQKSSGSLIWCNLIQRNDTLLHLLPHFDRLAYQTVPQTRREYKTHAASQALWHLKEACVWAFERDFESIQRINKSAKRRWPCAPSRSNKPAHNKSLRNWISSKITPIYYTWSPHIAYQIYKQCADL